MTLSLRRPPWNGALVSEVCRCEVLALLHLVPASFRESIVHLKTSRPSAEIKHTSRTWLRGSSSGSFTELSELCLTYAVYFDYMSNIFIALSVIRSIGRLADSFTRARLTVQITPDEQEFIPRPYHVPVYRAPFAGSRSVKRELNPTSFQKLGCTGKHSSPLGLERLSPVLLVEILNDGRS